MPDEFRLPTSSYEELARIIRAYGREPKEAGPPQIAKTAGTPASEVSRNGGFLLGVGILEEGPARKKFLTDEGRDLAKAIDHQMSDEIARAWRAVIQADEFLSRIVTAVEIRNGMEPESLHSHVAFSAGQPKTPRTMTGARTVAAILENAGLIEPSDGKYVPTGRLLESGKEPSATSTGRSTVDAAGPVLSTWRTLSRSSVAVPEASPGVAVQIQVQVQVAPDQLAGLAAELRQFLKLLAHDQDVEADADVQGE